MPPTSNQLPDPCVHQRFTQLLLADHELVSLWERRNIHRLSFWNKELTVHHGAIYAVHITEVLKFKLMCQFCLEETNVKICKFMQNALVFFAP